MTKSITYLEQKNVDISKLRPQHLRKILDNPNVDSNKEEIIAVARQFLDEFWSRKGGYRDSSWTKLQSHWRSFDLFCQDNSLPSLPTDYKVVTNYLQFRALRCHRNTLKADLWAINTIHFEAGFPKPCDDPAVNDVLKRLTEDKVIGGERIKQATPINIKYLNILVKLLSNSDRLVDLRDACILSIAYCCLLRGSELRNIKLQDINFQANLLTIPFTKTNHSGDPDIAEISDSVIKLFQRYIEMSGLDYFKDGERYLFTSINKHNKLNSRNTKLSSSRLADIYNKAFSLVGKMFPPNTPKFSTHSTRVGATQDLWNTGNVSLEMIMVLGRWSKPETAYRYGRGYIPSSGIMNNLMG